MPKSGKSVPRKTAELSEIERTEIVTWHNAGLSVRAIARKVRKPKSTVQDTIQNWTKRGSVMSKHRSGRPAKVTTQVRKRVNRYLKRRDDAVATEIVKDLDLDVTPRTVQKVRLELGYKSSKGKPKITLTEKDKRERVKWCKRHLQDKFTNMIFSDEKPFELYKRRRLSWTKRGAERKGKVTVKYPPKIQCWGGISRQGKTQLVFWKGRPKSKDYCDTLKRALLPAIKAYYPKQHRFLHDRDSTHKSKETLAWLEQQSINSFLCPVRSPDLNPIEMIWNTLEYKAMSHNPMTEEELERCVIEEWDNLDQKIVNSCIDKVISRIPQVIKSGGEFVD
jgi:transposase